MERDEEAVDRETSAAAAEAGAIGGRPPDDSAGDPARLAVEQAGGGESEGFEQAEQQLVDAAEHGGRTRDPAGDAITPEVEADLAGGAVYGEGDHERSSEREEQQQ